MRDSIKAGTSIINAEMSTKISSRKIIKKRKAKDRIQGEYVLEKFSFQ